MSKIYKLYLLLFIIVLNLMVFTSVHSMEMEIEKPKPDSHVALIEDMRKLYCEFKEKHQKTPTKIDVLKLKGYIGVVIRKAKTFSDEMIAESVGNNLVDQYSLPDDLLLAGFYRDINQEIAKYKKISPHVAFAAYLKLRVEVYKGALDSIEAKINKMLDQLGNGFEKNGKYLEYSKAKECLGEEFEQAKNMLELYLSDPKKHGIFEYVEVGEKAREYEGAKLNAKIIGAAFIDLCVADPNGMRKSNVKVPEYLKAKYIRPAQEVLQSLESLGKKFKILPDGKIKKSDKNLLKEFYEKLDCLPLETLYTDSLIKYHLGKELFPLLRSLLAPYPYDKKDQLFFVENYLLRAENNRACNNQNYFTYEPSEIKKGDDIAVILEILADLSLKVYKGIFNKKTYNYLLAKVPEIFTKELDSKLIADYYKKIIKALCNEISWRKLHEAEKYCQKWRNHKKGIKILLPPQTEVWKDIFTNLSGCFIPEAIDALCLEKFNDFFDEQIENRIEDFVYFLNKIAPDAKKNHRNYSDYKIRVEGNENLINIFSKALCSKKELEPTWEIKKNDDKSFCIINK